MFPTFRIMFERSERQNQRFFASKRKNKKNKKKRSPHERASNRLNNEY